MRLCKHSKIFDRLSNQWLLDGQPADCLILTDFCASNFAKKEEAISRFGRKVTLRELHFPTICHLLGTTLEDSRKTFSNHSARKAVVKKLKIAGLERSSIVKVTGHRNEKSLDDYDEGDENEQRQLSHTISRGTNINSQVARGNSSTSVHSSTNSSSNTFNPSSLDGRGNNFNQAGFAVQMPSYISGQNDQRQSFMNMNHFHQSGAPNDRFLSNAFRCCFRLSGVLLKLCRLILACTKKLLSVRIF